MLDSFCAGPDRTRRERSRFRTRYGYAFARQDEWICYRNFADRSRPGSKNEHLKLTAELGRVPFDIAFVHKLGASILMSSR
jgi:hypothetical protein